jgi:muramoyltetrapeptide carboxypeptidase
MVATHVPSTSSRAWPFCDPSHPEKNSVPLRSGRLPESIAEGARIALVAPAGGLRGEEDVARAIFNVRSLGWEPLLGRYALEHDGYFAGTDSQRLADLNSALRDPSTDAVWCLRGGYGTARLLPEVDLDSLKRAPKPVIGFSDVTALHAAIQRHCGIVSFHGPAARGELNEFSRSSLLSAVATRGNPAGRAAQARTIRGGSAEGVLAGGNLAVLASLVGTPYAPDLDGAILVLEDIGERTYRIDRMLRQMYQAGLLEGCRAILFGECTDCSEQTESGARSLDTVLAETADLLGVPCIAGAPVGHILEQWTLPLGAAARLDADGCVLEVFNT